MPAVARICKNDRNANGRDGKIIRKKGDMGTFQHKSEGKEVEE
jgi:hypothetical protein